MGSRDGRCRTPISTDHPLPSHALQCSRLECCIEPYHDQSHGCLHVRTYAGTQALTHARSLARSLLLRRRRHLTSYGACSTVSLRRVVEANVAGHHTCHACEERLSVCRLLLVHIMAGHERIGMLDTRSSIVNEHLGPFRALLSTNKMSTEHLRYLGMFWCA